MSYHITSNRVGWVVSSSYVCVCVRACVRARLFLLPSPLPILSPSSSSSKSTILTLIPIFILTLLLLHHPSNSPKQSPNPLNPPDSALQLIQPPSLLGIAPLQDADAVLERGARPPLVRHHRVRLLEQRRRELLHLPRRVAQPALGRPPELFLPAQGRLQLIFCFFVCVIGGGGGDER